MSLSLSIPKQSRSRSKSKLEMDLLQRLKHEKRRKDRLKLIKLDQKVNSFCTDVEQFKTNMSLAGFFVSVPDVFWGTVAWWIFKSSKLFSLRHRYRIIYHTTPWILLVTLFKEYPPYFWAGTTSNRNNFSSHLWWWYRILHADRPISAWIPKRIILVGILIQ